MRLLTHNMLQCHAKGCDPAQNYPLELQNCKLETLDIDPEPAFVRGMLAKIDYSVLHNSCASIGIQIPNAVPDVLDDQFLEGLGHALLKIRVIEGEMKCNGCGHIFPIKNAIPNMLLEENEV